METITRIRKVATGQTDEHNLPIVTEQTTYMSAVVAPRTTAKTVGSSEVTVTEDLIVYLPAGTNVLSTDMFEVRDRRYLVDGESFNWVSPFTGWNPGVTVELRKAENV
jgi:hypothetical protein